MTCQKWSALLFWQDANICNYCCPHLVLFSVLVDSEGVSLFVVRWDKYFQVTAFAFFKLKDQNDKPFLWERLFVFVCLSCILALLQVIPQDTEKNLNSFKVTSHALHLVSHPWNFWERFREIQANVTKHTA